MELKPSIKNLENKMTEQDQVYKIGENGLILIPAWVRSLLGMDESKLTDYEVKWIFEGGEVVPKFYKKEGGN